MRFAGWAEAFGERSVTPQGAGTEVGGGFQGKDQHGQAFYRRRSRLVADSIPAPAPPAAATFPRVGKTALRPPLFLPGALLAHFTLLLPVFAHLLAHLPAFVWRQFAPVGLRPRAAS